MFYLSYATLHLATLRNRAFYWNEAYLDPTTNKLSKSINDFELYLKRLFDWQEQYIKDLETIRNRLMAWRLNNISGQVAEDFKQYQDGMGGNAYRACEWHDTITGLKWYRDTLDAGFLEDNAGDHRREAGKQTLEHYRDGMQDVHNKIFQHEGQEMSSYAYHLAHGMAVASRWQYFCLPQGGRTPWRAFSLQRVGNKIVLYYGLSSTRCELLDAVFLLQFPIHGIC